MNLDPLHRWEQRIGALPMPSPLVWIALVAAFLGFGVLMGRATGPNSPAALAARRVPLKLLVAAAPAIASSSTSPATPPPSPEAETTPEAPPVAPAGSSKSSKQPAASGASSSSGSSGGSQETSASKEGSSSQGSNSKLPAIKHVFVVMLSDEPYAAAFGPSSPAHYLAGTLEKKGELLVRYYAVAHEELANGIALLSGQGPTEATAANCPTYADVSSTSVVAHGQVLGKGCVYPASTKTLAGQLTAKHLTWKAYVEGIGEGTARPPACAHPASGAVDQSAALPVGPGYQTLRNPFVYFHSILGSSACAADDVGMGALKGDLASERRTASFSYIAPGPCDDGSATPCAPGKQAGMTAADGFLKKTIPEILASKAYKHGGLLAITVDQAPAGGEFADSSSCCGQPRFPNLPAPTGAAALVPQGGGQVGLLLLSPFVKGGGLIQDTYDHFSLLATIEQLFGLPRLGYAGLSEVKPLSASLFSGG
ncbi:MAG TPA: alkaline phosphatase family protein [Solirubrobacteraceae bacterium]|nr:alkaline phosphatase family protein [Solirubrobacteraceae bacterium]